MFRQQLSIISDASKYGTSCCVDPSHNSWNLGRNYYKRRLRFPRFQQRRWPRNADGSLPTINFLKLAAGSDLIDKGVNVGIAYTGIAPDLGAYEYGNQWYRCKLRLTSWCNKPELGYILLICRNLLRINQR